MDKLKKYAELIVKTGVNLEQNQILVINAPIECAEFTRLVATAAYQAGAREVQHTTYRMLVFREVVRVELLQTPETFLGPVVRHRRVVGAHRN